MVVDSNLRPMDSSINDGFKSLLLKINQFFGVSFDEIAIKKEERFLAYTAILGIANYSFRVYVTYGDVRKFNNIGNTGNLWQGVKEIIEKNFLRIHALSVIKDAKNKAND